MGSSLLRTPHLGTNKSLGPHFHWILEQRTSSHLTRGARIAALQLFVSIRHAGFIAGARLLYKIQFPCSGRECSIAQHGVYVTRRGPIYRSRGTKKARLVLQLLRFVVNNNPRRVSRVCDWRKYNEAAQREC